MRKSVLSAWLCFGLVVPAFPAIHKIPADEPIAVVQISEKWQTKEQGEFVKATSPDSTFHFLVIPAEPNKIAASMNEVMRYVRGTSGITVDSASRKDEKSKLNGMDVQSVSWDGKDKNGAVKIQFRIISIAERKPLLVACWGSPPAEKKHRGALNRMLQSIKKA